jgi:Fe-S cluster assembly ATP-binding protein
LRDGKKSFLVITHYQRLLDYIIPDFVHIMYDGRIVKTGDKSLALDLEARGYDWVKQELAVN